MYVSPKKQATICNHTIIKIYFEKDFSQEETQYRDAILLTTQKCYALLPRVIYLELQLLTLLNFCL